MAAAVARNDELLAAIAGESLPAVLCEECRLFPPDILAEAAAAGGGVASQEE